MLLCAQSLNCVQSLVVSGPLTTVAATYRCPRATSHWASAAASTSAATAYTENVGLPNP